MHGFINRAHRLRAALHAVQEVAGVVGALGELHLERLFFEVDQVLGLEVDTAAVNVDPAFSALEGRAVVADPAVALLPFGLMCPEVAPRRGCIRPIGRALETQGHPAAEFHVHVPGRGRVARPLGMECSPPFHFHRPAQQIAAAPDGDVHRVNAPAGDESERILRVVPPSLLCAGRLAQILHQRPEGRRSEPHVVIQPRGHRNDLG